MTEQASDIVYRPIPQGPDADPSTTSADMEGGEEAVYLDDDDTSRILEADSGKIRGIHFILGCAVLLPWNGMSVP